MTITEFLLARIAEDEDAARPRTVVVSGGYPAPEVPNCIGTGNQPCGWKLESQPSHHWWKTPETLEAMRAHEMTHITPIQRRALAECAAKRAVVGRYEEFYATRRANWMNPNYVGAMEELKWALQALAAVYKDHTDYDPEWALA